jgi:enoyl-CoA hydratase/carnithine racemase
LDKIKLTQQNLIATLIISRPEKENAVDAEMMTAMVQAIGQATRDDARILVLHGEGEHFCGGLDPGSRIPKSANEWSEAPGQIVETNQALAMFPGISLAAVRGKAHGFGFGVAIQSDITLAADGARFGVPEIKGGFPPTIVVSYLSRWTFRKKGFGLGRNARRN